MPAKFERPESPIGLAVLLYDPTRQKPLVLRRAVIAARSTSNAELFHLHVFNDPEIDVRHQRLEAVTVEYDIALVENEAGCVHPTARVCWPEKSMAFIIDHQLTASEVEAIKSTSSGAVIPGRIQALPESPTQSEEIVVPVRTVEVPWTRPTDAEIAGPGVPTTIVNLNPLTLADLEEIRKSPNGLARVWQVPGPKFIAGVQAQGGKRLYLSKTFAKTEEGEAFTPDLADAFQFLREKNAMDLLEKAPPAAIETIKVQTKGNRGKKPARSAP